MNFGKRDNQSPSLYISSKLWFGKENTLSPSAAEIFRRTSSLFRNVDRLDQIALTGSSQNEAGEEGPSKRIEEKRQPGEDNLSRAGAVLRSLNEYKVRSMCGEAIYSVGLQNYMQGRVSDKRFLKIIR